MNIDLTQEEEEHLNKFPDYLARCDKCNHLGLFHMDNTHCCTFTYCLICNCETWYE